MGSLLCFDEDGASQILDDACNLGLASLHFYNTRLHNYELRKFRNIIYYLAKSWESLPDPHESVHGISSSDLR